MTESAQEPEADQGNWTLALRRFLERRIPLAHLLPDRQPYFVGSWVYVFGVVAIAALIWIVATGHRARVLRPAVVARLEHRPLRECAALLVRADLLRLHGAAPLGSVLRRQLARRAGADLGWSGVVIFAVSVVATFTGYVAQQNFDAQWIAINAKDAMNAVGVGAFFNVLNFGQMYGLHILFFPIAVGTLVGGARRAGPDARRRQADRPARSRRNRA